MALILTPDFSALQSVALKSGLNNFNELSKTVY